MIKKIMNELFEQYNEKFECEIFPNRYEFYSENHLYVYYRKSGQLVKNFQDRMDALYRLKGWEMELERLKKYGGYFHPPEPYIS